MGGELDLVVIIQDEVSQHDRFDMILLDTLPGKTLFYFRVERTSCSHITIRISLGGSQSNLDTFGLRIPTLLQVNKCINSKVYLELNLRS